MTVQELQQAIELLLTKPVYFRDILEALSGQPYRTILQAWSVVRTSHDLDRDEQGRYVIDGTKNQSTLD